MEGTSYAAPPSALSYTVINRGLTGFRRGIDLRLNTRQGSRCNGVLHQQKTEDMSNKDKKITR